MVLDEVAHGHEVADGTPGGELVGERGIGGGGKFADFGGHPLGFATAEPVFETVAAPLREVLFADGFAFEFFFQHGPDVGVAVEPSDDGRPALPALKPKVDLFPQLW